MSQDEALTVHAILLIQIQPGRKWRSLLSRDPRLGACGVCGGARLSQATLSESPRKALALMWFCSCHGLSNGSEKKELRGLHWTVSDFLIVLDTHLNSKMGFPCRRSDLTASELTCTVVGRDVAPFGFRDCGCLLMIVLSLDDFTAK